MSFEFYQNGKKVTNQNIKWKFATHPGVFESNPLRFQLNVNFWKNKLGLPADAKVEILNGDMEIEVKKTIKVEDHAATINNNPLDEFFDQPNDSESSNQSDISEDTTDPIDTAKPKRSKKATKL